MKLLPNWTWKRNTKISTTRTSQKSWLQNSNEVSVAEGENGVLLIDGSPFTAYYEADDYSDVFKIVDIEMRESEVVYNMTNTDHTEDDVLCNAIYEVRIVNSTDKPIEISAEFIVPDYLWNNLMYSSRYFGGLFDGTELIIEPSKGWTITNGILMKHTDRLLIDEKEKFNSLKNDLDVILRIDGKMYFIKIDDLSILH